MSDDGLRPPTLLWITFHIAVTLVGTATVVTADCPPPPEFDYASHNGGDRESFSHDELIVYTCQRGYGTSDRGSTICQDDDTWYAVTYTCRPINCGDPGALRNGQRTGDLTTFGEQFLFTCNVGYTLRGSGYMICMADGMWSSPLPFCKPVECPLPSPPRLGSMFPSHGPYEYGIIVDISCSDFNYRPDPEQITCTASGTWSANTTKCSEIVCDSSFLELKNGSVDGSSTAVDDFLTFSCDQGFSLLGAERAYCLRSAMWDKEKPTCISDCETPVISDGSTAGQDVGSFIRHGDMARYECNPGFALTGSEDATCSNGTLSGLAVCSKVLPPVINASMPQTSYREYETVSLYCGAINHGTVTLKWFENDEQIQGKNGEFLNIENVTREYNGKVIQCQVTNSAGSANFSFEISVTYDPTFMVPENEAESEFVMDLGDNITLSCLVDGNPTPVIRWMRGKDKLTNYNPELHIINIQQQDIGGYTCLALSTGFDEKQREFIIALKDDDVDQSVITTESIRMTGEPDVTMDIRDSTSISTDMSGQKETDDSNSHATSDMDLIITLSVLCVIFSILMVACIVLVFWKKFQNGHINIILCAN